MSILTIEDLQVEVDGKQVLKGVNLSIDEGEVHLLLGPNGSGKSTLVYALLGYPQYRIVGGRIIFAGKELNVMPIYDRVNLGIAVAHQLPPQIRGVKVKDILSICGANQPAVLLNKVGMDNSFLVRELNVGFSGGERKRMELAQIFAKIPKFLICDEIDTGVDIDSLKLIGAELESYIEQNNITCLIITHYRNIVPYLKPKYAYVLCGGYIIASGKPYDILTKIEEAGFCEFIKLCPPNIRYEIEKI